jgi:probable HAF family extracellular repeat protein
MSMKKRGRLVVSLVVVSSAMFAVPAFVQAGSIYNVTNLGNLQGSSGTAVAIAGGTIVGYAIDKQGNQVAVYSNGGALTSLGFSGQANGVNAAGEIVGSQGNLGFTWQSGVTTQLGSLGGGTGSATGINDSGQAVGGASNAAGQTIAVVYNSNGSIQSLGTLGGSSSTAYGINDAGQIAGTSQTPSGAMAAFFWNGQTMQNLETLGGYTSYGEGIDASGQVVGSSQIASGYMHAFLWTSGFMKDLGTLGGSNSLGYGVNDSGSVVGYSLTTGNAATHAFLYTNGVMTDLNSLLPIGTGWTITAAYGIDNNGDIVGTGVLNGTQYAVELIDPPSDGPPSPALQTFQGPIVATPEPLTALLLGGGLVVAGLLFRSKRRPSLKDHES